MIPSCVRDRDNDGRITQPTSEVNGDTGTSSSLQDSIKNLSPLDLVDSLSVYLAKVS